MSVEKNKAIIRRYIDEVYNRGDDAVIDELTAPEFVFYVHAKLGHKGPQGMKDAIAAWFRGFPDMHNGIEDIVAEGEKVALRLSFEGTHTGPMFGHAPTGKRVTTTENVIFRVVDGRVTELWEEWDQTGFMKQISGGTDS